MNKKTLIQISIFFSIAIIISSVYFFYFTENKDLQNAVINLIFNIPSRILEPSIGRGDLVSCVQNKFKNVPIDMYELDNEIVVLDDIKKNEIVYGDFMQQNINTKINVYSTQIN